MSEDEVNEMNDDEIMNITSEEVKLLYVKEVLKEIIRLAKSGGTYHQVRLLDEEVKFLENKKFNVRYMQSDNDYGERCKWYEITWHEEVKRSRYDDEDY